jgi:hypothetical protein
MLDDLGSEESVDVQQVIKEIAILVSRCSGNVNQISNQIWTQIVNNPKRFCNINNPF